MKSSAWNQLHALEIASVRHRLRTHAQRALHEADYVTIDGRSRRAHAGILRAFATTIERRQKLRLSVESWIAVAEKNLKFCDRNNPEEQAA